MPAATRKGDVCTGHGCYPPRSSTGGAGTVFINSIAAHCKGHGWSKHACPKIPPHGSILANGAKYVYAEGRKMGRIGDPVACGSAVRSGSGNVFIGDSGGATRPDALDLSYATNTQLKDSPMPYGRNIQSVDDSANSNPINNPEQHETNPPPKYEELSSGMCGEIPQANPYDQAQKALAMGNSAWKETGSNPNITALWDEIGYKGTQYADETAWCSVFVGATLKRSGNKHIKSAMARAYENYGKEIPWDDMEAGDIVVMYRNGKKSGSGHVGFATGKFTATTVDMIGGNQGNTLSVRTYKRNSGSRGVLTIRRAISCVDGTTGAPKAGQVNDLQSTGTGGQVT